MNRHIKKLRIKERRIFIIYENRRGSALNSSNASHAEKKDKKNIRQLVERMSLPEKCYLLSGKDFWQTRSVEREGIPSVTLSDGPHGVRKQEGASDQLGLNGSLPATCYPTASSDDSQQLGHGTRRRNRCPSGHGSRIPGRMRAARPGAEHQAQPALRT